MSPTRKLNKSGQRSLTKASGLLNDHKSSIWTKELLEKLEIKRQDKHERVELKREREVAETERARKEI